MCTYQWEWKAKLISLVAVWSVWDMVNNQHFCVLNYAASVNRTDFQGRQESTSRVWSSRCWSGAKIKGLEWIHKWEWHRKWRGWEFWSSGNGKWSWISGNWVSQVPHWQGAFRESSIQKCEFSSLLLAESYMWYCALVSPCDHPYAQFLG